MENSVRSPGGTYTEKITSFSQLKVGDVVSVLNNNYNESEIQGSPIYSQMYYTGTITQTEPSIIFKDPPKKKFASTKMTIGTTFRIEKNDGLLTQIEQGFVRIYRDPVATAAAEAARKAEAERKAAELQQTAILQPAANGTPGTGGGTKRKRRRNKKSKRRYKRKIMS